MSDRGAGYDEDGLPWLQGVDDEDAPRGVSAGRMLAALLVVLLAAAIVVGTFFWMGRRNLADSSATPELIRADPAPYKVKSNDRGGLDIAGESETAFETSAGQDTDAQLDMSKVPETPIAKPVKQAPPAPAAADSKAPPAVAKPEAPPSGGSGSVIQLGAYANPAQAERAWTALSARFPSVAAMTKMVVPFAGGIRLRAGAASPAEAKQACSALKVAGENCFVAN